MIQPILMLALLPVAHAEGAAELGATQPLQGDVVMAFDILAPGEVVDWFAESIDPLGGANVPIDLEISDPASGAVLGTLHSGEDSGPMPVGTWTARVLGVDLDGDGTLESLADWDLTVRGAAQGRVWSRQWEIRGPDFSEASRFDGSFFALLDGGSSTETLVVEMKLDGLVGRVFFVKINSDGIYHFQGRSCPIGAIGPDGGEAIALAEFPIYLNPPEIATYSPLVPELTNLDPAVDQCAGVSPGVFPASIEFDTNVDGEVHLVCDLNGDGLDPASEEDIHIQTSVRAGHRRILWDGTDKSGDPVAPGTYDCQLQLSVGEFHFVAHDVETAYAGLRLFELDAAGQHRGLPMFWEDGLVQDFAVVMPNGQEGLVSSGPTGLSSGRYEVPAIANVNARAWGDFTSQSKGNDALLDTWTAVRQDVEPFTLVVLDPDRDRDGDGLVDATETCVAGTDPLLPDTDGDGLDDRFEFEDSRSDPLDEDSDDDGLIDSMECDAGDPRRDTDGDGTVDWADTDDDNDLVPTLYEDWDGDGDWTDEDVDGDGIPAWLDRDNDGDGLRPEDVDGDGDPLNDDSDGDGIPDTNDPDDDNDGIPTAEERGGDLDGDGIPNRYDPDDDGDGIPTIEEGTGDTDGDGDI
ncbi:MAG: hypothetical protein KC621_30165, partial [Myxococcales bacterium]|nr:hypothetical protein [Myxococcales bacterium]